MYYFYIYDSKEIKAYIMNKDFTIGLFLKPYVHQYLVNKFGNPVNLYDSQGGDLKNFLIGLLKKPSAKYEKRIKLRYLTHETRIVISKSDFYRYGWEITKTDMIKFNNWVESQIKFYARCYISFDKSLGIPISRSIRNFQDEFEISEDLWSYDSIKKDFDRHGAYIEFDKISVFKDQLRNLFLEQLSEIRQLA